MSIDSIIDGVIGREGDSAWAFVAGLFNCRRPAAISRRVVAIYVDAIERLFWGPVAHVGKKVLEARPPLANFDATPSIVRVLGMCGHPATAPHRYPRVIGPVRSEPVRAAMCALAAAYTLAAETAAALSVARRKTMASFRDGSAALAFANPLRSAPIGSWPNGSIPRKHRQASIGMACAINQGGHWLCP